MKPVPIFILVVIVLAAIVFLSSLFVVDEMHHGVVTQFEKPKREITEPGLYFKIPFIQKVSLFPKQVIQWKGSGNELVTKDKTYIWVNTWARWRITQPLRYYQALRTERNGHGVLDDQIESAAKDVVAAHDLIGLVRNSNRELASTIAELKEAASDRQEIDLGRDKLRQKILERANSVQTDETPDEAPGTLESVYGIELVDVQISTVIYVKEVQQSVYGRMQAERKRIAQRYRSEGKEQANEILGEMQRELKTIASEGYREAQQLRGEGDAEALSIYAAAYSKNPEFYGFWKTLNTYRDAIDDRTTLVLSLDNEYFKIIGNPDAGFAPNDETKE